MPRLGDVHVGQPVPGRAELIDQDRILRYAGASGDFNPLHWDPATAAVVSPTGEVIAHGMLSLGLVTAAVTEWAGGADRVLSVSASFRGSCPVGETLHTGGEVLEVDEAERTATLRIWAELADGSRIVDRRRSRALVRLS